jgi:hypothetical protein
MDRSLAAWGEIAQQFPAEKDRLLDLLLQLDRIRKRTEMVFPNARAFVRPGFDTPASSAQSR